MKKNQLNKTAKYQFTIKTNNRFDGELLCRFTKLLKNLEWRGTDAGNKFVLQFFRKRDAERAANIWVNVLTCNAK